MFSSFTRQCLWLSVFMQFATSALIISLDFFNLIKMEQFLTGEKFPKRKFSALSSEKGQKDMKQVSKSLPWVEKVNKKIIPLLIPVF